MKNIVTALGVGILFGVGLVISGMTDAGKVIGFLDVTGRWNPALMFVMGGAVTVYFFGYRRLAPRRDQIQNWHVPTGRTITPSLALGAVIFGVGWGLAGYCPGPALISAGALTPPALVFSISMFVGMGLVGIWRALPRKSK